MELTLDSLLGLAEVIAINVALSGDNALVIGLAAAGLPVDLRGRAILFGILAATVLRVLFAVLAGQLMHVFGVLLAGGLLLLWVTWKMWSELRSADAPSGNHTQGDGHANGKTMLQAVTQIVVADISMSLDNVLAVVGAAGENMTVLVAGLVISIVLMGVAASFIAGLLNRWSWIAYAGLAIIFYVAVSMTVRGADEVWPALASMVNSLA
ncbi:MAG: YjbE family putative metal transport protein [Rhizobiaceae bacterium]|nr:YjbE family putative metal transport protein [Rhizobiaceae bacterium]